MRFDRVIRMCNSFLLEICRETRDANASSIGKRGYGDADERSWENLIVSALDTFFVQICASGHTVLIV